MIFTVHKDSTIDFDGTEIKEFNSEFDSPFVPWESAGTSNECFVIYKGLFGSYKIRECRVTSIWFTNIWGWRMDNGWTYTADSLGKTVFKHEDLQKAIEICEANNRYRKVKVKYL